MDARARLRHYRGVNGPAQRLASALSCGFLLAAASCGGDEPYLLVHVPAPTAAAIARLELRASVAGTMHTTELPADFDADGGAALTLPSSVIVRLPPEARGPLTLTIDEQLADGTTMAAQTLTTTIAAHGQSEVTLAPVAPWKSTIVTPNDLDGVWAAGPTALYTAGDGGAILRSSDGDTWTPETSSVSQKLQSLWASGPNDIYAVGVGATIVHSVGAGAWTTQPAPSAASGKTLHLVWGSDAGHVYIVGDGGLMLTSTNRGQSWTPIATSVTTQLNIVWGAQTGHLLISGETGAILRSTNNGGSWTTVHTGATGSYIWSIWGTSASDIYAAGAKGVILHSTDDGATWTAQSSGQTVIFYGCAGGLANDVYCVGDGGTIVHSSNHGATWVTIPSGVGSVLNWALPVPALGAMLVCGDGGVMLRSF
jgi:photosystem II stability/assembly factor-like uncharacterized protein